MNGIRDLVKNIFIEAGMPDDSIQYEPYLPGFYRARKRWDMAVKYRGALVAALEFKSQVGSEPFSCAQQNRRWHRDVVHGVSSCS
jgi:hypothetical protein